MKKIILVLDNKGRYLQKKNRFDSLDIELLKENFIKMGYQVNVMDYFTLSNTSIKDELVVYTSSQIEMYKAYIEDVMYYVDKSNKIIPSYEVLCSHENKFFQEKYNKINRLETNINSWFLGDISEFDRVYDKDIFKNGFVVKGINGSSSSNVTICDTYEEGVDALTSLYSDVKNGYINETPKNLTLYPKEVKTITHACVYEKVDFNQSDYRVHFMGNKMFGHRRDLLEGGKYTSGNESINNYIDDIPEHILDFGREVFSKIDSPFAILDIAEKDGKCFLFEWSGIQLGIISLLKGKRYYEYKEGNYIRTDLESVDVEFEFANSINEYINGEINE